MSRKLNVTRLREISMGWSFRQFDFELKVNDVVYGIVKDGQTVVFSVPEDELLLEVFPRTVNRRIGWCAIIPAGKEDYSATVTPWTNKDPVVEQMNVFRHHYLSITPCPTYLDDVEVDIVDGLEDCFSVHSDADLDQIVDLFLEKKIEPTNGADYWNRRQRSVILILTDAAQPERSANGKSALEERCVKHNIGLMLGLGNGYYQNLISGALLVLKIVETRKVDLITYGKLDWEQVLAIPSEKPGKKMRGK